MNYFVIFLLGSFLGWLYEWLCFNKNVHDRVIDKLYGVKLPFLPLYGVAYLLIVFVDHLNIRIPLKIIIATFIINFLECVAGLISHHFYGYHTWEYGRMSACHGYISLYVGLFWTGLITIYYVLSNSSFIYKIFMD
jgi:uncharacterized membrane protein